VGFRVPQHGDLPCGAVQGVLLLNTVLSVRAREPRSHAAHGWHPYKLYFDERCELWG